MSGFVRGGHLSPFLYPSWVTKPKTSCFVCLPPSLTKKEVSLREERKVEEGPRVSGGSQPILPLGFPFDGEF